MILLPMLEAQDVEWQLGQDFGQGHYLERLETMVWDTEALARFDLTDLATNGGFHYAELDHLVESGSGRFTILSGGIIFIDDTDELIE